MEIKIEDFEKEYVNRFSPEHFRYILEFCNTFQKTFPGVMDKDTLLKRLSWIKVINETNLAGTTKGDVDYSDYSVNYQEGQSDLDERNAIYHELFHVISLHDEPQYNKYKLRGLYEDGSIINDNDFYFESEIFDEIMNEFYTMKMLETEGTVNTSEYILKRQSLLDLSTESVKYHGTGYRKYVQLADLYDRLFGDDLLKAKLFNKEEFAQRFNEKYKEIKIDIPGEEDMPLFAKVGNQIFSKNNGADIYGAYATAIELWKVNEREKFDKEGFSLYDYLADTNELMGYLPEREDYNAYRTDKSNKGIPDEIFERITQMDYEFICKYIDSNVMSIQDETERTKAINSILTVVNILRENIDDLTEQDLQGIKYGIIKENEQKGRSCMVVQAGDMELMCFVDNSEKTDYQFSAYSKFKRIQEYKDFNYGDEEEKAVIEEFERNGIRIDGFEYAIITSGFLKNDRCALVKAGDKYYKTEDGISEVSLTNVRSINEAQKAFDSQQLALDLQQLSSERAISGFIEMDSNIRKRVREVSRDEVEQEGRRIIITVKKIIIAYYNQKYDTIIQQAPSEKEKNIIRSIRDDERKHNKIIRDLYYSFTGDTIQEDTSITTENNQLSYKENLEKALFGELDAVVKYRKILSKMPSGDSYTLLMLIMTDELRHASKYNYLIHNAK